MGYTPLFDSLTRGTLCGRWPDIGLWPIVLSLADKNGVVDVTAEFLASVTGLQLGDVIACMKRFCEPDPCSRSQELEGARLRLIDPQRGWGWIVVNHGKYKEKARLQSKAASEVQTGGNADRMRDRRRPPETAADPLSKRILKRKREGADAPGSRRSSKRAPEDFLPDSQYALAELPDIDVEREIQKFRDHEFKSARSDWPAVWRNWVATCRDSGRYAKKSTGGTGRGLPRFNPDQPH